MLLHSIAVDFDRGSLRPANLPLTANAGTTEGMAKGKPTPEKSKIERDRPLAYSRRQKSGAGDEDAAGAEATNTESAQTEAVKPEAAKPEARMDAKADASKVASVDAAPPRTDGASAAAGEASTEPPVIVPSPTKGEPWPDATPQPMRPVEPARGRAETMAMPPELVVGVPPPMPAARGAGEQPTLMPGPRDIPAGNPDDPAPPPESVPSGDSRSLRKGNEFALVYRAQTAVISRFGVIGTRGVWRVVDYPTSSSASNAYAKEVSRFVAEGFSDYRD